MKKLYSLALAILFGIAPAMAQDDYGVHFISIDENQNKIGNIADGSTITVSKITDNGLDDPFISAGVGAENTSNGFIRLQVKYDVLQFAPTRVQCCAFGACTASEGLGTYYVPVLNSSGQHINLNGLRAGRTTDLAAEWFPTVDGTTTIKITLLIGTKNGDYDYDGNDTYDVKEGPSITVNFVKGNDTGINSTSTDDANTAKTYFDTTGRKVSNPTKGVYVEKKQTKDGSVSTRKVVIK